MEHDLGLSSLEAVPAGALEAAVRLVALSAPRKSGLHMKRGSGWCIPDLLN